MDFVLVDAGHRYEQVVRDSQTALAMRSARGMVVWHDYAAYEPGVVRLNELASDLPLVQVDGTSLVVYLNPAGT